MYLLCRIFFLYSQFARFSHSPDRLPTPDRIPLNPIPENRQIPLGYLDHGNYYENVGPGMSRGQHPSGIYDSLVPYMGYHTAPPIPTQPAYIACSTRAPGMAYAQRANGPGFDIMSRCLQVLLYKHVCVTSAFVCVALETILYDTALY